MAEVINLKKYENLDIAGAEADKEVKGSGGARSFPVTIFKQGKRTFMAAVFPVYYIVTDLSTKPTEKAKGPFDVRSAMNRPLDPAHAKNTKEYIKRNFKNIYILPPMTLNIQQAINVYTTDYQSAVKQGFMVIPLGVKLSVTDGQHRQKALQDLYNELTPQDFDEIKDDGITVMITVENRMDQIHQDFADCSKTKELPKSMIAVYDKRNPANSLTIDLMDKCPLFKDKIDASSSTLSKKSSKLFLASQVRSGIKELLFGSSAMGDVDFEKRAIERYAASDSARYKNEVITFIDYINKAAQKIPILKQIADMKDTFDYTLIPDLRSKYILLNSAGFNILCRIGFVIFQNESTRNKMDAFIDALAKIDWRKDAPIWKGDGNIIQPSGSGLKIATSNSTIKMAVNKVKEEIGLNAVESPTTELSQQIEKAFESLERVTDRRFEL